MKNQNIDDEQLIAPLPSAATLMMGCLKNIMAVLGSLTLCIGLCYAAFHYCPDMSPYIHQVAVGWQAFAAFITFGDEPVITFLILLLASVALALVACVMAKMDENQCREPTRGDILLLIPIVVLGAFCTFIAGTSAMTTNSLASIPEEVRDYAAFLIVVWWVFNAIGSGILPLALASSWPSARR